MPGIFNVCGPLRRFFFVVQRDRTAVLSTVEMSWRASGRKTRNVLFSWHRNQTLDTDPLLSISGLEWRLTASCTDQIHCFFLLKRIHLHVKLHDIMDRKDFQKDSLAFPNYSPDQNADQIQPSSTFWPALSHFILCFLAFRRDPCFLCAHM